MTSHNPGQGAPRARGGRPNAGFLPVFTIGHSAHPPAHFASLLQRHLVDWVLDVRSSPYSRRAPQYNRPTLKGWLDQAGIRYSFGGGPLGGRPADPAMYRARQADYERMAQTESFRNGLRRIASAARSYRVALLCAEADPIECHRFLLVGRALAQGSFDVRHILPNGELESQRAGEQRMLDAVGLRQPEFFEEAADVLAEAYYAQAGRVAFTLTDHDPGSLEWRTTR